MAAVVALGATGGCSAEPTNDPETGTGTTTEAEQREQFLADVADIGGDATDDDLLTAAQEACFEMELHVETGRDFRLFYKVFAARGVVPAEEVPLLLAAAMKTYCPSMEKFRPDTDRAA